MNKLTKINSEKEWLELRKGYVTSTQTASLFGLQMGCAPTAFELWHIKHGNLSGEIEDNNFMKWGRRFQDSIAYGFAEDNSFIIEKFDYFAHNDETGMGSSFDFIGDFEGFGRTLFEIKVTDYGKFKENFKQDLEGNYLPPHYNVIQCQHEAGMLVGTEFEVDYVCQLTYVETMRDIVPIWHKRDPEFFAAIQKKVAWFNSLTDAPEPDLERDAEIYAKLHKELSDDTMADLRGDVVFDELCQAYLDNVALENKAISGKLKSKGQVLMKLGKSNKAYSDMFKVSNVKKFDLRKKG
jgi:predicted phage-related endonuclease